MWLHLSSNDETKFTSTSHYLINLRVKKSIPNYVFFIEMF